MAQPSDFRPGRHARIKPDANLWARRRVILRDEKRYPNGRVVWYVTLRKPSGRGGWMHVDARTFAPDEVEVLDEQESVESLRTTF